VHQLDLSEDFLIYSAKFTSFTNSGSGILYGSIYFFKAWRLVLLRIFLYLKPSFLKVHLWENSVALFPFFNRAFQSIGFNLRVHTVKGLYSCFTGTFGNSPIHLGEKPHFLRGGGATQLFPGFRGTTLGEAPHFGGPGEHEKLAGPFLQKGGII